MIPTYSQQAKSAIALITQNAYLAFIYFEDKDEEHLYEELLKSITPLHKSIRVICLNGKTSLIEHHQTQKNSLKLKSLYVLDKDFDDKLSQIIKKDGITYLKKYSIENHLITKEAVSEIATEEKPKCKESGFLEAVLTENLERLLKLTSAFLVAQRYNLWISNCGESIHRFTIEKKPWTLCDTKILEYYGDVENLLVLQGHAASEEEISQILREARESVSADDIPGKMLLDLVKAYICHKLSIRGLSQESFRFRLAKKAAPTEFRFLATEIQRITTRSQ